MKKTTKKTERPASRITTALTATSAPSAAATLVEWARPTPTAELGIRHGHAFTAVDQMTIVSIAREYRRRFSSLGEHAFKEAVTAARLIMWTRIKNDFPAADIAMHILVPKADIGVVVKGTGNDEYVNDPRLMQERFDAACRDLAEVMGV